jgi:transcriptional regulator with XRE-family HTH domain
MEHVRTPADLGAMARAARTARGWSQQEAADAAGVSRRFVNMVEGGQHPNAEVWRVLALMNALGAPLHAALPEAASATAHTRTTADFDLDAHLGTFRKEGE